MTDRFASLKGSNTFKRERPQNSPSSSLKTNSRFDSLSEDKPINRFASKRGNNKRFYKNRGDTRNNNVAPNIGKFTQVGTGEVYFTPQRKSDTIKQKRKKNNMKPIKKEEINEVEINNDADIALTLALAEKYQYFTESEEEEEEGGEEFYDHGSLTPNTGLV